MAKVGIEIFSVFRNAGTRQAVASFRQLDAAAAGSSAVQSKAAQAAVRAEVSKQARIKESIVQYRALARSSMASAEEQVAAAKLAEKAQLRLVGTTKKAGLFSRANSGLLSVTGFGVKGSLGLTAGLGLFAAVKEAAGFQQQMNIFGAVSEATTAQMKAADAEAIKLGNDTKLPATSASDAAQAMTELSKAGLSVTNTISAAHGVLLLSAAANISNADAAAIAARSLNAFGLKGEQATHVADLLAAAANVSSGEMSDIAEALSYAAASASQAHVSIDDTVAAIAELANKGIIGSQAGSALQQMLLRLESPTKKAKKALDDLGISVYDQRGRMLPLPALIQQFSDKTKGLSDQQRNAAMNAIFGARAIRAANVVLLGGVSAFEQSRKGVERQGAAADIAAARNKGLAGAWDGLKSAADTLAIRVGSQLTPTLEKLTRAFSAFIGNARVQVAIIKTLGIAFKALVPAAAIFGIMRLLTALRQIPLTAGIAAAETDAELATIGTTASTAGMKVSGLRGKLAGLGALQIAPILIPIEMQAVGAERGFIDKHAGFLKRPGKALLDIATASIGGNVITDLTGIGARKHSDQESVKSIVGDSAITGGSGQHGALADRARSRARAAVRVARVAGHAGAGTGGVTLGGRFNLAQLAFAQAGLTASTADDRAVLEREKAITAEQLKQARTLADKTTLTQRLADITGQIRSIDESNRQKAQEALQKHRDAERARAEKAKEHAAKIRQQQETFTVPFRLQLAAAKAATTATETDDIRVAKATKKFAEQVIKSGKKRGQALIDAYNEIASANQTIGQQTTTEIAKVSTRALTAGLNLSHQQRVALEQRFAQAEAHNGRFQPGAVGVGGHAVTINVNGVHDPETVAKKVVKHLQRTSKNSVVQTRGRHGGVAIIP